ncbi:MAG TPA: PP2C family serine/threonine-protein phosphatase [Ktedonobacterales bacterium]|nr:PP2C family serine/threonine-protein phosphatase [Ktedonobacterales bacterium]
MALRLIAASKTDVGKQRDQNEDNCYANVLENDQVSAGLFIVADGMGGYHAGEVASKIAVDAIGEILSPVIGPTSSQPTLRLNKRKRGKGKAVRKGDERDDPAKTRPLAETQAESEENEESDTGEESEHETRQLEESIVTQHYADKLRDAIERSSEEIVTYGQKHPEARGLGSTVTAALAVGDQAFIANVGDSRTYLLRDGKLERLTQDHSLVERLVEAGQISREDVYDHPNRNLITRSLGAGRSEVEVDIYTERLRPGDALLLCSDGLWEMVHDPQLESILNEVSDPAEACDLLIERANENGGEDNITAVLVRCLER